MGTNKRQLSLPRCICLAGPTASGKTAAALVLAQRWPVEVISVDSALVYRSMDIGTAKPSAAELAAVPHHLIDIRDPLQAYSAAEFATDARRLMTEITARGRTPLLVGGTMLYFKALFEGLDDMPRADPAIRASIESEAAQLGWPAMHAQLAVFDPISAARLQPNDAQRVQRALEVYRISGRPLSSFQLTNINAQNATDTIASKAINTTITAQYDEKNRLFIALEPADRAWLHERIAQRFDLMLTGGFEQEVRDLRARGDLTLDTPSIRCVGYRQMWEALDACGAAPSPPLLQLEMRDKGIAATRQLAKRQLTWLRSNREKQVVVCDAPDALDRVISTVADWLNQVKTTP
jgi:tRNA dimethylallyltransferase